MQLRVHREFVRSLEKLATTEIAQSQYLRRKFTHDIRRRGHARTFAPASGDNWLHRRVEKFLNPRCDNPTSDANSGAH